MEVRRGPAGVEGHGRACSSEAPLQAEEEMDLRRGPWTVEEDLVLVDYIRNHGEGRWNSLARCAGLKRTGKSCRLRWLNYLRPDVRRGNITPEEQLLILELHSRWGNRWSKIAQHLPGRTDNEIKNYWRTRVQKHAKQLRCDVNSKQFKDVMRYLWMPRLLERIHAASSAAPAAELAQAKPSPESSSVACSSSEYSLGTQLSSPPPLPPPPETYCMLGGEEMQASQLACGGGGGGWPESLMSPAAEMFDVGLSGWAGDVYEDLWSAEDNWFFQQ